jgi:hypothetical protein
MVSDADSVSARSGRSGCVANRPAKPWFATGSTVTVATMGPSAVTTACKSTVSPWAMTTEPSSVICASPGTGYSGEETSSRPSARSPPKVASSDAPSVSTGNPEEKSTRPCIGRLGSAKPRAACNGPAMIASAATVQANSSAPPAGIVSGPKRSGSAPGMARIAASVAGVSGVAAFT